MTSQQLALPHPINQLKIHDLEAVEDGLNPPQMYLLQEDWDVPYMPAFLKIDIQHLGSTPSADGKQYKYFYQLTQPLDENWQWFFKANYKHDNVTFDGNKLVLSCTPKDHFVCEHEICAHAIHAATRDYWNERKILFDQVLLRMRQQEQLGRTEREILTELEGCKQQKQECMCSALENGLSVKEELLKFRVRYREVLEVKFGWWRHIVEASSLGRFKAVFEAELLCG